MTVDPPDDFSVSAAELVAVIALMLSTIVPSKVLVGVTDRLAVDVVVGPHAPVADKPVVDTPPKLISNVPAVLPVTVKAI